MVLKPIVVNLALLLLLVAHPAQGQNTEDQNTFDFSLPGARSRAIGGAFVAIADDATSVYSNPAGLTLLFRPEVSVEGRLWSLTSRTLDRGHGFGRATGVGVDTIDGFVEKDFHSKVAGLSFRRSFIPATAGRLVSFGTSSRASKWSGRLKGRFSTVAGAFAVPTPRRLSASRTPWPTGGSRVSQDSIVRPQHPHTGAAFARDWSANLSTGIAVQDFNFSIAATNKVFNAQDEQKYQPPNFADPDTGRSAGRWARITRGP